MRVCKFIYTAATINVGKCTRVRKLNVFVETFGRRMHTKLCT